MKHNKYKKTSKITKNNTSKITKNNTSKITKNNNIILSSNCTNNHIFAKKTSHIINKKFNQKDKINISVIITAKMNFKNKSYKQLTGYAKKKFRNQFKLFNIDKPCNIDYIDFSNKLNHNKAFNSINSSDIIWVVGGDTFYLWYYLKKYNIDKIIHNKIKKDNILYIGCCAGAIIAGETINPAYIERFFKKSKRYNLENTYKKKFWYNIKNKKTLKLIKNKDFLPHCNSSKNKKIQIYKNANKIYCLPEYKLYIK